MHALIAYIHRHNHQYHRQIIKEMVIRGKGRGNSMEETETYKTRPLSLFIVF
ncbi:unnamed protein product [Brassica rapa]|uniref:Uncharacterized protein n=2 Tax=Brassica TaxID=3705 RepID=A0A8D9LMZ7_BRACM|nr:unnamed protein product [Brassica napus]CAG7880298.1 unnamed protein product [Brassica rapa]